MSEDRTGAEPLEIVAVSVGNTNTTFGLFRGLDPEETGSAPSADADGLASSIGELFGRVGDPIRSAIVIASVNPEAADALVERLRRSAPTKVFRFGEDLDVPMQGRLDPEAITGQDRVLNALAAFHTMRQACVVVDAGTAITVDFVDGEGVFHGGAIAPGLRMSLAALHERTASLPKLQFAPPDPERPFGRDTAQAMLNGVYYAARGLVRALAERYALAYGAYPPVVATGGAARALFADDELVDRIVPDLALRGVAVACRTARGELGDDEEAGS